MTCLQYIDNPTPLISLTPLIVNKTHDSIKQTMYSYYEIISREKNDG